MEYCFGVDIGGTTVKMGLFTIEGELLAVSYTHLMKMLKDAYEEAKRLLSQHRDSLDKIAAFLIEKETITGKEFMNIFHEVEGIDPESAKKSEERIATVSYTHLL